MDTIRCWECGHLWSEANFDWLFGTCPKCGSRDTARALETEDPITTQND